MAETLGMLCDKLTIVKLKEFHSEDPNQLLSLQFQSSQLKNEIDEYIIDVFSGKIAIDKLKFHSNKVFKQAGNEISNFEGNLGEIISQLAKTNCELWHVQEHVYDFESVPIDQKNHIVKQLAILNLERNQCIDKINQILYQTVEKDMPQNCAD